MPTQNPEPKDATSSAGQPFRSRLYVMRELSARLPYGRGFHEKAVSSQPKKFAVPGGLRGLAPWRSMRQRLMARKSAPMPHNRYRHLLSADFALGPLSLISVVLFSARERSCQGRRLVSPAQRTLDRKAPSLIIGALGKGGGVSGGFAPWRSMRQRLMARSARPARHRAS